MAFVPLLIKIQSRFIWLWHCTAGTSTSQFGFTRRVLSLPLPPAGVVTGTTGSRSSTKPTWPATFRFKNLHQLKLVKDKSTKFQLFDPNGRVSSQPFEGIPALLCW